jgi:hypothetical protein
MVVKIEWITVNGHTVVVSFVDPPKGRIKKYTQQLDAEGVKYTVKTEEG